MARLEHVNLVVDDIEDTLDFILTAFPGWGIRGRGNKDWYGKPLRWLHLGDDDCYLTLNDNSEGKNRDLAGHAPGLAHIGFKVEDLDGLITRLQAKGYSVDIKGADHPFRKSVYFVDPAGFQFEFIQYLSDKPEEKNMYGGETSSIQRMND